MVRYAVWMIMVMLTALVSVGCGGQRSAPAGPPPVGGAAAVANGLSGLPLLEEVLAHPLRDDEIARFTANAEQVAAALPPWWLEAFAGPAPYEQVSRWALWSSLDLSAADFIALRLRLSTLREVISGAVSVDQLAHGSGSANGAGLLTPSMQARSRLAQALGQISAPTRQQYSAQAAAIERALDALSRAEAALQQRLANVGNSTGSGPAQPLWASASGSDAHGYWADLQVAGVSQRLRWIPPGQMVMGPRAAELPRLEAHSAALIAAGRTPQDPAWARREVTISRGYWLGATEVTQALWQAVLDENPSYYTENPLNPANFVTWRDCQRFLQRLEALVPAARVGLPSEAQWEYAARAGSDGVYWFGDALGAVVTYDNIMDQGSHPRWPDQTFLFPGSDGQRNLGPVASYPANPWGLHDVHGNVSEWTADHFAPLPSDPAIDPSGPSATTIINNHGARVIRGGNYFSLPPYATAAWRSHMSETTRTGRVGLRLMIAE